MKSVAAFVAALVLAGMPLARADTPSPPAVYVALGDSFSAGPGIAPNLAVTGCLQSAVNYPHLVAAALHAAAFRDVTCSGATTGDLWQSQSPSRPAQFDALTPDTTLVTVGVGANDVGLVPLAVGCLNFGPPPYGRSCAAARTPDGADSHAERADRLAATYAAVIGEIRSRAPRARVLLVGYPTAIRPGGCPGIQPVWPVDADYLESLIVRLNAAMATGATNATFVDLFPSTRGHDVCAPPQQRWIEGAVPTSVAAPIPLHPNAAGHENAAAQVLTAAAR
ncbi:SGNH/GDSL hydrolase family protein [Rhodococcus sp. NPDC003322]